MAQATAQHGDSIATLARQLLDLDEGELKPREKAVIEKAAKRLAVSRNMNVELQSGTTFGQRVADRVAEIGGSWGFIIAFGLWIAIWVILMSQNRAAARDRLVANHDYEVNLKAEIEIAALHEKLDQIRSQELATLIKKLEGEVAEPGR